MAIRVSDEPEIGPNQRIVIRTDPPTAWCTWWTDLTKLTDEIYYGWPENDDGPNPWFWHWCSKVELWRAQGTGAHDLIAREPLHLEPSLLWPCCNLHGWVRSGIWSGA